MKQECIADVLRKPTVKQRVQRKLAYARIKRRVLQQRPKSTLELAKRLEEVLDLYPNIDKMLAYAGVSKENMVRKFASHAQ